MSSPHEIPDDDESSPPTKKAHPLAAAANKQQLPPAVRKLLPGRAGRYKDDEVWNFGGSPSPPAKKFTVPRPSRSILDNHLLQKLVSENSLCKICETGSLTLTLVTDKKDGGGIGTIPHIGCDNEKCRHQASVQIPNTGIGHTQNNNNRVTDHAVNVQFVLSHLCSGDGGAEAEKTLGFLGLPCSTTMHNVFTKVEAAICPFVEELTKESMRDALFREVWETPERQPEGFSFHKWKEAVERHDITYNPELYARVWLSMDMGWNKRSSDHCRIHCSSIDHCRCCCRFRFQKGVQKKKHCHICGYA